MHKIFRMGSLDAPVVGRNAVSMVVPVSTAKSEHFAGYGITSEKLDGQMERGGLLLLGFLVPSALVYAHCVPVINFAPPTTCLGV